MKTKISFSIFLILAVISACGGQGSTPTPSSPAQALLLPPTLTLTPSSTPLPPIPDFDQVVNFGGGGGGRPAIYPGFSPSMSVFMEPLNPAATLYLWGVRFNLPFQLQLISPDGRVFQSTDIWVENSTGEIQWEGYQAFLGGANMAANPRYVSLLIWWPNNFPSGQWHISASGDGLQASTDFIVEARNGPSLDVLDTRPSNEIIPFYGRHPAHEDGTGDLVGLNYHPNIPVYLLLYHESPAVYLQFELLNKQVVVSDSNGTITAKLAGLSESEEQFLVVGVSDPETQLSDYTFGTMPYPFDNFGGGPSITSARPASYTLQAGEFVYCIARRFNVDPRELLAINGLGRSQVLYSGLILKIPQSGKPFPGDRSLRNHPATYAVVSSNQTLGAVACLFGDVDPAAIARSSGISPTASLYVGQQLNIP
jgi:hypothetical protein